MSNEEKIKIIKSKFGSLTKFVKLLYPNKSKQCIYYYTKRIKAGKFKFCEICDLLLSFNIKKESDLRKEMNEIKLTTVTKSKSFL